MKMLRDGNHHSPYLQRAYDKYGEDAIVFTILETAVGKEELLALEQKYIDDLKPKYNVCKFARSCLGVKRSKESKMKFMFPENKGYRFKYKSACVVCGKDLPEALNACDVGKVCKLIRLINPRTNMLSYRTKWGHTPYTAKHMAEIIGVCRSKFHVFMKKLKECGVMKYVKYTDGESYYSVNPIYFNATQYIPLHLYLTWKDDLDKDFPPEAIEFYIDWIEAEARKQKAASPKENAACGTDQTKDAVT